MEGQIIYLCFKSFCSENLLNDMKNMINRIDISSSLIFILFIKLILFLIKVIKETLSDFPLIKILSIQLKVLLSLYQKQ